MQEKFLVSRIKCAGCASAIQNCLHMLSGVQAVAVDIAGGTVEVTGVDLSRTALREALAVCGYPERREA